MDKNFMYQLTQTKGKLIKNGKMSKREIQEDTVPALLQIGEIVIPRRIVKQKKFIDFLEDNFKYRKGKFIK